MAVSSPSGEAGFYSVREAAEALKVSEQTIKRRIKNGELRAEQRPLPGKNNFYWVLSADQIHAAVHHIEVVPITRAVQLTEIQQIVERAVKESMEAQLATTAERTIQNALAQIDAGAIFRAAASETLKQENAALRHEVEELKLMIAMQAEQQRKQFDELQAAVVESTQRPRGFFDQLAGLFGGGRQGERP